MVSEDAFRTEPNLDIKTQHFTLWIVCHLLGDYYEAVKSEMEKAATIYKTTCDQYNYGRSCTKYGDLKAIGKWQDPVYILHDTGCLENNYTSLLQILKKEFNKH